MRYAPAVVIALTLIACAGRDGERPPSIPTAPPPPTIPVTPATPDTPVIPDPGSGADRGPTFWGMVIDASGACIKGATVRLASANETEPGIEQDANCDVWAYGGGVQLYNLVLEVEVTLVASAPGYASREVKVIPSLTQRQAVLIELSGTGKTGPMPLTPLTLD
jgi:hypothetical protein